MQTTTNSTARTSTATATEVGDNIIVTGYTDTPVIINTIDPIALCRLHGGTKLVTEFDRTEVALSPRI